MDGIDGSVGDFKENINIYRRIILIWKADKFVLTVFIIFLFVSHLFNGKITQC